MSATAGVRRTDGAPTHVAVASLLLAAAACWAIAVRQMVLTIAAGVYELTPLKRSCRRRCRVGGRSGLGFGISCVGSSAGLMLVLVVLGPMSVTRMAAVGGLVVAQKLVPPRAAVDVPLALALVGLGIATAL